MAVRLFWPTILVGLIVVSVLRGQVGPEPADRKDRAGNDKALPVGAIARFGSSVFRFSPSITPLAPDFKTFLVPDLQGGVSRFDVATGRALDEGTNLPGGMVLVSGDGKRFISLRTGNLSIRELESGKEVSRLELPMGISTTYASNAPTASLSHDGSRVAQGGQSMNAFGIVIVTDVEKKEVIFQAPMQYGGTVVPLLSPDGRYLATRRYQRIVTPGGKDDPDAGASVQVWDVDAGSELFTAKVTGGGAVANGMAFSSDGKTLAVSCGEGPIDLWDVPGGKHRLTLLGRTRQGQRLALSADGKTLAALSGEGVIQRWDATSGKPLDSTEWPAEVPLMYPQGVAFSRDGRVVAWGASGPAPVVWEAPSGKVLSPLPEHIGTIRAIGFAAGGKELITASQDGRIIRWDAATGKPLGRIAIKTGRGAPLGQGRGLLGLSQDGSRAMTGFPAAVYDLTTGTELFAVPGSSGGAASRFIVPADDLSTAVTLASPIDRKSPGVATVWDLKGARKLGEVETEPGRHALPSAVVTPEGSRLVVGAVLPKIESGQQKMTLTSWDMKTGKKLSQVEVSPGNSQMQLASPDEDTVLVSDGLGKLRRLEIGRGKFGEDLEPTSVGAVAATPIVFNADRTRFAVGTTIDGAGSHRTHGVRIHEWPSGKVLHTFECRSSQVSALCFSPDGKQLASGSFDGTTLVWDLATIGK